MGQKNKDIIDWGDNKSPKIPYDERMRNLANMMDRMKYLPPIQFEKNHNND